MYRHILAFVDCTDDGRRLAVQLAKLATPLVPCRVTLAAAMTPSPDSELNKARRHHAEEALTRLHDLMHQYGVWSHIRIVEGEDHAVALTDAICASRREEMYEVLVLGTHHSFPEDLESPCKGSLLDRIVQRTDLPVMVLPTRGRPLK